MTYPQITPYTDRLDYLTSMLNNFAYVITMEKMLQIEVPERVNYIRVIMSEFQRIASHLVAIGTYGIDIGALTPFLYCFEDRERIMSLLEMTCGARMLYNYMWIGGLSHDLHPDFERQAKEFLVTFKLHITELNNLLSYNKIFIDRTANVGVLPSDVAINYGVTGPILRASGVKFDLRKNAPYAVYDKLDFNIPVGQGAQGKVGDCWDRYMVRVQEMEESVKIIEQALDMLPEGDINTAMPKRVKPAAGTVYNSIESAKGELGFFIVSDGTLNPSRVKVRPCSFINLSVITEISKGHLISDLVAILGSIDIVLGEVDR
jgi:NADH-quinone oxidoreductase subunit D